MDLSKLLRRKQKAEDEDNQQLLAEMCNKLGNHYMHESKYQNALGEFRQESNIYQALDKKMDHGRANRMIGEVYVLMGKYKDALKHEDLYLKISKQENDLVEMQRAYATIGRCYLLQAEDESVAGSSDATSDFKAAEKAFLKGLIICKELGKLVSKWELADMQARLYLNLGVTKEHIDELDDAISYYDTAIKICKSNDLFELHHQCLMASGLAYFVKKDDVISALNHFNVALAVSKRIQDKHEKRCETLLAKSSLLIKTGDYQSAKPVLKKAYKLGTPHATDKEQIQKNLKIVLALCKCEDELVITNSYDYAKRKELFEKLGDGSCKLKSFSKAIDFYLKSLEASLLNGDDEHQMIPIYVSLYQTYIDNKDYESALEYMNKEYELIRNEPKEACATLIALGNLLDLAGKDFWEVDTIYRKAIAEARKTDDRSLEKAAMVKLVKFSRNRSMISLAEILEQEAAEKGIELIEVSEDLEYSEDIPDICNDISLELQLSSDPESSDNERPKPVATSSSRKKRSTVTVKKNAKGETRLHEVCINGNYQMAKMLIDQGHAINVRDNAGWLPLHEAAIHGFRDIVELLLDSGAQSAINDKGGTSCEGITPLYDAASNGNLSVVQLLLDRGAKATVKTDFSETPHDAIQRWYESYGRKLSPTEKEYYDIVKLRLMEHCAKVGIDTAPKASHTSSSGYQTGRSRNSQGSQPKSNLRFNTSFSDESDEEPEPVKEVDDNIKKTARLEYKNVMNRLKNPHNEQRYTFDEPFEQKKRAAHLTVQEVGPDEWLEDDLGPSRKKQKFFNGNAPEDRSPSKPPTPVKSFSRQPSTLLIDSESDVEVNDENDIGLDAFELVMNAGNTSKKKSRRRNSASKPQRRPSSQPSVLDSGFARFIEVGEVVEKSPTKSQSHNSSFNRSNPTEKQLIIKVQIEDEKVIVPLNKDDANELKISWLVEEAARRYYCIKGIRPELKLKTVDGATLLQSDPVALILSLTEENLIHSEILDWKLPSLSKRYLEACSERKCSVDQEINELLEINHSAVHLDLSNQNLNPTTAQPILKALQHQSCLLELNLSSNFIQNEGVKFLSQALVTLKQLQLLDISGNMLTESGLEHLCNALAKSTNPVEITRLSLSFNPIKSNSLKFVSNLCQSKGINALSLKSCELTDASRLDQLSTVKSLDLSYNHFTGDGFKAFLRKINPGVIETLNFERCSSEAGLGDSISQFISSGCFASVKEINLAGLNLSENEILGILRNVEKCEQLNSLDLSHHKHLTCLSLKYLLFSLESRCLERVKLIGCKNLQTTSSMFNFRNIDGHRHCILRNVQLSMPGLQTELTAREDYVQKMKELWDVVSGCRGKVEHDKSLLRLTYDDVGKDI